MKTTTSALKFLWNGIKNSDGKLQRATYSASPLINFPEGTITIYAKDYSGFSKDVWEALTVSNDSDIITDYFEKDRARVVPSHPLYAAVKDAHTKSQEHYDKRFGK